VLVTAACDVEEAALDELLVGPFVTELPPAPVAPPPPVVVLAVVVALLDDVAVAVLDPAVFEVVVLVGEPAAAVELVVV
jgi:hypothetical protein